MSRARSAAPRPISPLQLGLLRALADITSVNEEWLGRYYQNTISSAARQGRGWLVKTGRDAYALSEAGRQSLLRYEGATAPERQTTGPVTDYVASLLALLGRRRTAAAPDGK